MTKSSHWLRIILPLLATLFLSTNTRAAGNPKRPNFLFVLIDDMGYRDLSCFGGTRVQTPEIDRLAREGIRFNQFYVSAPICSPSRVALTTGQYPNRWHITSYLDTHDLNKTRGQADWLSPDAPSLARFVHDAGYYTAHVGKWHMGGQRDVADAPMITRYGFDTSLTNFEGLGPRILAKFDPKPNGNPFNHVPTELSAKFGVGPITWVERHRVTQTFVDRAIEEMKHAQQQSRPFYINLWPDDVHSPCQAPPTERGDDSPAANYLAVLHEADKQLGRAFEYIRSNPDLRDNTIILLCSDNGHEQGLGTAGDLRGSKGQLYEGGIRSPLIVWSPTYLAKEKSGASNDQTVIAGIDFAPSILALAGIPAPPDITFDGLDLSETLTGKSSSVRPKPVMWVRPPDRPGSSNELPDLAIRDANWKLLVHRDASHPELFDIIKDPNEKTNLAYKKPAVAEKLTRQVIAWDKSIPR
jgi:arylsulfatase A-like enzyme